MLKIKKVVVLLKTNYKSIKLGQKIFIYLKVKEIEIKNEKNKIYLKIL